MRFLLREQPYEKIKAAGTLSYELDGQQTGAAEHWRYSALPTGHFLLRVDLDARPASGDSFLYHTLLNSHNQIENVRWRYFGPNGRAQGQVLFEAGHLISIREINGTRYEEEEPLTNHTTFFFPSSVGLWQLQHHPHSQALLTLLAYQWPTPADFMRLQRLHMGLEVGIKRQILLSTITWTGEWRKVWFNEAGWPLKMERPDGLQAISTHLVMYG